MVLIDVMELYRIERYDRLLWLYHNMIKFFNKVKRSGMRIDIMLWIASETEEMIIHLVRYYVGGDVWGTRIGRGYVV